MAKKRSQLRHRAQPEGPTYAYVDHTHPPDYPPQVADIAARDAILGDQRYEGVVIYVLSDQTTYQLRGGIDNTDWQTLVTVTGVASHTTLGDIGTNTHVQIDAHIADATLHFTQAAISITESQISDLQAYVTAAHNHDSDYLGITDVATSTNALESATSTIDVSAATAPLIGQVLTATAHNIATWQFPPGGASGTGDIVQTGAPTDTYVGYFTADKNLSGDSGFTWITASARMNVIGGTPSIRIQDSNSAAATMVARLEFFDSSALVSEIGHLSGSSTSFSIRNTVGDIVFDTDGADVVTVTGDGDIDLGGYLVAYAGTPTDGQLLTWVTANGRAEFVSFIAMTVTGVPVDNMIAVFDGPASADGDANFTWDGADFTAGDLFWDGSVDQLNLGGGDLATPGIVIDGSATATPFINLEQLGVPQTILRYNNTLSRTELSSLDDEIALRPGNVDRLTLTAALSTLTTAIAQIQDGYLVIDHTIPQIRIQENDAALDQKNNIWVQQNESLTFDIYDDAYANPYTWLQLQRSGTGAGVQVDTIDLTAVTDITLNSDVVITGDAAVNGTLIAGDPGVEGTGIQLGGVLYNASLKVSDIGGSNAAQVILHRHSTTIPSLIVGARTASDTSAHTIVADTDILFGIIAAGWDGVDSYSQAGQIRFAVDGTPGANDMPGRIDFLTTPDASETPVLRMSIRADGSVEMLDNLAVSGTVDGVDIAARDLDLAALEDEQLLYNFLLMGA